MTGFIRRVVTGHDERGRSVVVSDGFAPVVNRDRGPRRGRRSTDLWLTTGMPVSIRAQEVDPTLEPGPFVVPMGTKMRVNEIAPEPPEVRNLPLGEALAFLKSEADKPVAKGAEHPGSLLHRTETIDYAFILSGEMTLYLDEKEVVLKAGDMLVQRGTAHAWRNLSDKPARILFVLIDGRFDSDLKALFGEADR